MPTVNASDVLGAIFDATVPSITVKLAASAGTIIGSVTGTVSISSGTITTVTTVTNPVPVAGDVADNSADSGNPVKVGGLANAGVTTTAATAGTRVNAAYDLQRRQIVSDAPATWTTTYTSTAATAITLFTYGSVAGRKHVVTSVSVAVSAATTANDVSWYLRDGATGSGTVKYSSVIGTAAVRGTVDGISWGHGIEMSASTPVTLDVDSGGAGVVIKANLAGYTE